MRTWQRQRWMPLGLSGLMVELGEEPRGILVLLKGVLFPPLEGQLGWGEPGLLVSLPALSARWGQPM